MLVSEKGVNIITSCTACDDAWTTVLLVVKRPQMSVLFSRTRLLSHAQALAFLIFPGRLHVCEVLFGYCVTDHVWARTSHSGATPAACRHPNYASENRNFFGFCKIALQLGWHTARTFWLAHLCQIAEPCVQTVLFFCAFVCHFELELVAGLLRVLIARGRPVLCQFALGVRVQKTMTLYGFCRIGLWLYCVG